MTSGYSPLRGSVGRCDTTRSLMTMEHLLVRTTTPDLESAREIARSATGQKFAATAKIGGPLTSVWWHLGEQGEGEEWQVEFQTTSVRYAELESHIIAEHPWNKPEVTTLPLGGSRPYLDWLESATES